MSECPCRDCAAWRNGSIPWSSFLSHSTPAERLASARKRYVQERPDWRLHPWTYTTEWFEREVEEILGLTHARHLTQQLREQTA